MLLIECPYCAERRPELEFQNCGEAHKVRPRDPGTVSDEVWAEYLYGRANPRGFYRERWRHTYGCARFFNAIRNTVTDEFLATYKTGDYLEHDATLVV